MVSLQQKFKWIVEKCEWGSDTCTAVRAKRLRPQTIKDAWSMIAVNINYMYVPSFLIL